MVVEQLYIDIDTDDIVAMDILMYPNPVIASDFINGSDLSLGFYISNMSEIELYIYNMLGHLRLRKLYDLARDYAGSNAYNLIDISFEDFNGPLSAGAYFFVMVADSEIVGQGKFGVQP